MYPCRVREAHDWVVRLTEDFENLYYPGGIWNSLDSSYRTEISLEELESLELMDDEGKEVPIYSEDGYVIQQWMAWFWKNQQDHGVLMNLSQVHELFSEELEDRFPDGVPGVVNGSVWVYPQAGLRTAGHFQAEGVMTWFYPHIEKINHRIVQMRIDKGSNEDQEEMEAMPHPPITVIASQGYNAVMHSTQGVSNQHHDAQLGMIMSTLAGSWANTESNKKTAEELKQYESVTTWNIQRKN
jgi:hypothetical protein